MSPTTSKRRTGSSERKRRVRFTQQERTRLAVKGRASSRRALAGVASIGTPDTILRGVGIHEVERHSVPPKPNKRSQCVLQDSGHLASAEFRDSTGSSTPRLPLAHPDRVVDLTFGGSRAT